MTEEIKEDNNCIVKAFENNPIAILHEDINSKKMYYFKASDIGKALGIVNIRSTIQNYDDDERVVRNVYDPYGTFINEIDAAKAYNKKAEELNNVNALNMCKIRYTLNEFDNDETIN